MRGDMQVRFGGRYGKTYCRKAVRRPVPSLREGKGGNIFALAGEFIKSSDFLTQARYVAEVADMPMRDYEPRNAIDTHRPAGHSFEDVEVLPLQSRALLHYLQERGIPSAIAVANCKEMRYTRQLRWRLRDTQPVLQGLCAAEGRHPAAVRLCRL